MAVLTYKGSQFIYDGEPIRILSGAIHYFRIVPEYWQDRLQKLKACGFNTVETCVAWNFHEPQPGQYRFEGMADIERFIQIAGDVGLHVIVRPSPYICAEWEEQIGGDCIARTDGEAGPRLRFYFIRNLDIRS